MRRFRLLSIRTVGGLVAVLLFPAWGPCSQTIPLAPPAPLVALQDAPKVGPQNPAQVQAPRALTPAEAFGACGSSILFREIYAPGGEFLNAPRPFDNLVAEWKQTSIKVHPHFPTHVIRIPVVVHVLFTEDSGRVPAALINAQIAALNRDFRADRTAADMDDRAGLWAGWAADAFVEFELAKRTPWCSDTKGVLYATSNSPSWEFDPDGDWNVNNDDMKFASEGGADAWDPERYLNIWVCELHVKPDNDAGIARVDAFGTPPPDPIVSAAAPPIWPPVPPTDGVVIDWRVFGQIVKGPDDPHYDTRREGGATASHEVGHWLDLIHPWGTCESSGLAVCDPCGTSHGDQCDDTPAQRAPWLDCEWPSDPPGTVPVTSLLNSCGGDAWPDMIVNLMDYTSDACRVLFTPDQVMRIRSTLHLPRVELLGSQGLVPPVTPPDLWLRDAADDVGIESDPTTAPIYLSPDIWTRNAQDGGHHQEDEGLVFDGKGKFVYVRVSNRGCGPSPAFATLHLYWAKGSTALGWRAPWDGSVNGPYPLGAEIGSQTIAPIEGGKDRILVFSWQPPDPKLYSADFGAQAGHFCLLARIETDSAEPYGMTHPEGSDLALNVRNNNNIAWKNLSILSGTSPVSIITGNLFDKPVRTWLRIRALELPLIQPPPLPPPFGHIVLRFSGDLAVAFLASKQAMSGLQLRKDGSLVLADAVGLVGPFEFPAGARGIWTASWEPDKEAPKPRIPLLLDVSQWTGEEQPTQLVGGQVIAVIAGS